MKILRSLLVGTALLALVAQPVWCSGFSVYEQSAKASAQAGAFVARADDASANWYNPAALVRQGASVQFGINAITIGSATTLTLVDDWPPTSPMPAPAGTSFEPEGNVATPIHLYYARPAGERWAWGVGVTTPFGLVTEWTSPISFAASKSELAAFVFNANGAYAINDYWAVALGVDYLWADIKNFGRDLNAFVESGGMLPPENGSQNLTGDGGDVGFNLAVHYTSERFSTGLSYRSGFSPELEGDLVFTGFEDPINVAFFQDTKGKTTLDLPDQGAIGFAYTPERWELEFDISWAKWSRFQELDLRFDNPAYDVVIPERWDDTFAFRIGGSVDVAEKHEVRAGGYYDQNPIPDEWLRPSIPDADRWSLQVGYGYESKHLVLDAYYQALFFRDRTTEGNPLDASVVPGRYESFSNLFGVTFSWKF